jgi:hypothetical protein
MAITALNVGLWGSGYTTGNVTPAIPLSPTTPAAGDLMVCLYGTKPFGDSPTINQGWSDGGSWTNGSTGSGIDTGSMQVRLFYKIHTGTESNPTITNTTNSVSAAVIGVFRKASNKDWDLVFFGGGDSTSGTAFSAASTTTVDLAVSDLIFSCMAIPGDNATLGSPSLSATGITFAGNTKFPVTDGSTASGQDMAITGGRNAVTAGSGDVTVTYATTLSANQTGTFGAVRMREVDPPAINT